MAASESPSSLSTARSSGLSKSSVDASAPILCTVAVGLGVGLIGSCPRPFAWGQKRNQVRSELSETQPPRTRTFVSVTARVKSLCHRPQIIKSASLVAAALQRAEQRAKLLKELVPPADLPGLRFREGQRLADGVEHAVQPWG